MQIIKENPFREDLIRPYSSLNYQAPAEFVAGRQKDLKTEASVFR
jgi:hypothetical protein